MMSWIVWTVSGKGRRLFVVTGLDITIPALSTSVPLGVFAVLLSRSLDCRFLVVVSYFCIIYYY